MNMDFGFNQPSTNNDVEADVKNETKEEVTNIDEGTVENTNNGSELDNIGDKHEEEKHEEPKENNQKEDDYNLEEGSVITVDDKQYTVDAKGNLLDENGSIFKEAAEVKEWMDGYNVEDSDNEISINTIQDALGVEITGEDGKPVKYENTIEGIKAYVNAVNETTKEEHMEAAINSFYSKYPIIQDVLNYYVANGNSLDGYNEVPDRSNITIDDNNETQQENIIRTAWQEQNRKGSVDGYIQYLKSSGTLLAVAKEELEGLKESDRRYKQQVQEEAERIEKENAESERQFWTGVQDTIKNRKIGNYTIPDSIIINRNGQKLSVTPDDFFDYIYLVDENGKSQYQHDLEARDKKDSINDTLIRAWLTYTGGTYSNLVDMAVNDKRVKDLKLKAKERKSSSIRITKPKVVKGTDIDFGYN